MSGRFLFVTWEGSGNLAPALAAAGDLAARGHEVRFLAHASQRPRIPFSAAAFGSVPDLYERSPLPPEEVWWEELFLAEEAGLELLDELERAPVEAVVVDCLLWGALSGAERAAVPTCVLVHSLYARRFAAEDLPARRERLNRTRTRLELDGVSSLLEPWDRAALVLVASARGLDRPQEPLPPTVVYAGPLRIVEDGPADLPWQPDVVAGFSSAPIPVPRTTQRVLDALAPLPVRCAVTSRLNRLRPGANTLVREWLPHDAVLPGARLAITHGGHGTVTAALRHGVPLLCLPMLADQPHVARRVEEAGAGLSLPPAAPAEAIRAAVQDLLRDPAYRSAAGELAAGIARELAARAHVPALEGLLP